MIEGIRYISIYIMYYLQYGFYCIQIKLKNNKKMSKIYIFK